MIIYNLNIFRANIRPTKTDSPPIVNTNAVLTGAIAFQRFQTVAGRYHQIVKSTGNLKLSKLASSNRRNICEPSDIIAL